MAETRPHQRVIAAIIAVLFFAFSSALSVLVIWQLVKDNKEAKNVNQPTSSSAQNSDTNANSSQKLQGTKLASFTPTDHIDSLQTQDTKEGNGSTVKAGDTVTVNYTGAVAATGVIFQSSLDNGQPATFSLDGVIAGWTQGIPGMKTGGTRRLLIPASLAYGANPPSGSGIPANADLVFDVTLISIGQ